MRFHLNQSLVLWVMGAAAGVISRLPVIGLVGGILSLCVFVLWIIAFIGSCKGEMKSAPLIDKIQLLN